MIRGTRGLAQLVVLLALFLVGGLATSFALSMRTEAQAARNALDAARAYYQARTGINRAIAELSSASFDDVVAAEIAGRDGDASYEVTVEAERGKIDVNFVSESVLKEVLRNGGLSADDAEAAGDSILSWRDDAGSPRSRGATDGDYEALPEALRPRHGRLKSIEELRSVRGVSPELFRRRLARVFTVYGRTPQVDVNRAPIEVLRVLPGFTPEIAAEVIARRKAAPFRTVADLARLLGEKGIPPALFGSVAPAAGPFVVTLTSTGTAGGGIVRAVRCTVEVGAAGGKAARILQWADHVRADEEPG